MNGKGHQGEHGAIYHLGAYPQWTIPCAPIHDISVFFIKYLKLYIKL